VILRLGQVPRAEGAGAVFHYPGHRHDSLLDRHPRHHRPAFKAEKTLTKDTVPVDVDAVLFWKVVDPKKAALDVADYRSAISWASQTALRDVIGKTMLSDMLEGRDKISSLAAEDHR
jgi:regulator of protease activity HflC (stomatin/prohibitin superfamily)